MDLVPFLWFVLKTWHKLHTFSVKISFFFSIFCKYIQQINVYCMKTVRNIIRTRNCYRTCSAEHELNFDFLLLLDAGCSAGYYQNLNLVAFKIDPDESILFYVPSTSERKTGSESLKWSVYWPQSNINWSLSLSLHLLYYLKAVYVCGNKCYTTVGNKYWLAFRKSCEYRRKRVDFNSYIVQYYDAWILPFIWE